MRTAAAQYMEDMLSYLENIIVSARQAAGTHYENLLGSRKHYEEIIQNDRKQLHPIEEDMEALEANGDSGSIDVISQ